MLHASPNIGLSCNYQSDPQSGRSGCRLLTGLLLLQNSQINVDDDSSSAAGRLSRQGLELQLETLRAQNLTLQRELLNLPPEAPASQTSTPQTPVRQSPAAVNMNPFNPTPDITQPITSPAPSAAVPASGSSGQAMPRPENALDAGAWTASFVDMDTAPPASPAMPFNAAGDTCSREKACMPGSGPQPGTASPRSTLSGPIGQGSPVQQAATTAAAPQGLGASHLGGGSRSPAPSSGASSSTADTDAIMAAVAQRKKAAVSP